MEEFHMNDIEFVGAIIREAREAKAWSQQQLADELEVDVRTVKKLEDGIGNLSTELFLKCVITLRLSADICIYAPHDETGLLMHRLFQQLLQLTPEQIDRVYKAARYIREWNDDHNDIDSWKYYMKD